MKFLRRLFRSAAYKPPFSVGSPDWPALPLPPAPDIPMPPVKAPKSTNWMEELKAVRLLENFPVGKRLDYLNRVFVVSDRIMPRMYNGEVVTHACLIAEYVDDSGIIQNKVFTADQLKSLLPKPDPMIEFIPAEVMTIQDFIVKHKLTLQIERKGAGHYIARFKNVDETESEESNTVRSAYGVGPTAHEAVLEFAKEIQGKWLVVNPFGKDKDRRTVKVPRLTVSPHIELPI